MSAILEQLRHKATELLPDAQHFLCELIRFPSTSGRETAAMEYLEREFSNLGLDVQRMPLSDSLVDDPDYSDPVPGLKYDGRFNLVVSRNGEGGGRSMILNTHVDVVPPSEGMEEAWNGNLKEGTVFGRGACDAKGQVATLYLLMRLIDSTKLPLAGHVILHFVVEEENGGNGSLAMVRAGKVADGCIVMEPSDNQVFTSIRGAVWFRLVLRGKAGHSGAAGQTRSALLMARDAIGILEDYHHELLERSRGFELFDRYPNPMPITFGRLHAGNWPAAAPSEAVLEGVLGFLPNMSKEDVCQEMRAVLLERGGDSLAENMELSFMYRHDCSVLDPSHPLPRCILECASELGRNLRVSGMPASCDAWFYKNFLGIPTVVYGPGSLKVAHSKEEQIELSQIAESAALLARVLLKYCGER